MNQNHKPATQHPPREAEATHPKQADGAVDPEDFKVLDPEAVALFLLKGIKDKNTALWSKWIKNSPAVHQREVFKHLPSWLLSFFQDMAAQLPAEDKEIEQISLHELFNEMALIEQSFKLPVQKKKAFLQWFPAKALRYVPRNYQKSLSTESKRTLWSIRPDLGNFVKVDEMQMEEMMQEPSEQAIESCVKELLSLPSIAFESSQDTSVGLVDRWITLINQLSEFGPISSQIDQAKAKLSSGDFEKLLRSVAHLSSPFLFEESLHKDWLRQIDPHDYFWWESLAKEKPNWDLKEKLRPMRWAMFSQAAEELHFKNWNEEERKRASERVLNGFREVLSADGGDHEREVA